MHEDREDKEEALENAAHSASTLMNAAVRDIEQYAKDYASPELVGAWMRCAMQERAAVLITGQLQSIALQLKYLGNGDAGTTMGAIEALGGHLGEKLAQTAGALSDLG